MPAPPPACVLRLPGSFFGNESYQGPEPEQNYADMSGATPLQSEHLTVDVEDNEAMTTAGGGVGTSDYADVEAMSSSGSDGAGYLDVAGKQPAGLAGPAHAFANETEVNELDGADPTYQLASSAIVDGGVSAFATIGYNGEEAFDGFNGVEL